MGDNEKMPEIPNVVTTLISCPFVYADGRHCTGHITRIEAYSADLSWDVDKDGKWTFDFQPKTHYHVFCSEKGNHAGIRKTDPSSLKFWYDKLPESARKIISSTNVRTD